MLNLTGYKGLFVADLVVEGVCCCLNVELNDFIARFSKAPLVDTWIGKYVETLLVSNSAPFELNAFSVDSNQ